MTEKVDITVEFWIKDSVKIVDANVDGRVIGVTIVGNNITYNVQYWHEGTCKSHDFYGWELEHINGKKEIGFSINR